MDVRIGVTQAPRELTSRCPTTSATTPSSRSRPRVGGAVDVLWLTDKRGRRVGVPAAKIAYIEVGTTDGDRRIGFGG